eukprot:738517-Hanusia_phi.AAC.1
MELQSQGKYYYNITEKTITYGAKGMMLVDCKELTAAIPFDIQFSIEHFMNIVCRKLEEWHMENELWIEAAYSPGRIPGLLPRS